MNRGPEARVKGHFTHQAWTWGQPVPQQGLLSVTSRPFPGTHSVPDMGLSASHASSQPAFMTTP